MSTVKQDIFNLPNSLTMLRIIIIPAVMYLMHLGDPTSCMISALLFTAAAVTDYLDGYIARKRGLVSITGKFLDPLADKLIVMAVLLMLVQNQHMPAWLCAIVLGREISITALRALASTEGIVMAAQSGGKYKTAFQLIGLLGMIIHYEYVIDWFLVSDRVNFHAVGFIIFGVSVFFSLWSGFKYSYDFIRGIDQVKKG
ncbi:MAG: CDP-diacylglycerol--glycerol-3-phosphate 3-phosphatidyltransferase [Myxococcales bacterium]|nr:CDP-diacylglycerol--glycerol-3-phosphate 3-phosphatidyltransferase [Myxococcales bacterium]